MTDHQAEILSYLRNVKQATLAQIAQNVSWGYYHNPNKYIGETLKRLVNRGLIERTKRGTYRYLSFNERKTPATHETQRPLF